MAEDTQHNLRKQVETRVPLEKRPCLVVISGDVIGEIFSLDRDVTLLGRGDDADIVLSDPGISRRHATLVRDEHGYRVSDLGSTNGTEVNHRLITEPVLLDEGDKITLGNVSFRYSLQDADDRAFHDQLRTMAIKDGLTRIFNKRYFLESIRKEFDFARRYTSQLSIILFDIDRFKVLNDTWGHPAGDRVLQDIATRIEEGARGYDVFARYGGEEFVLLLRGADLDAALTLAERTRRIVEMQTFPWEDQQLHVTISVGVATYRGDDAMTCPEQLVELADQNLYAAKHAGRNCVRF